MEPISESGALAAFCARVADAEFITVDTEFIRDKTYWPRLCLIQIGGPDEAVTIDALADGIDLQPVLDLMAKPDLLKVFHAARQDFEIFFQLSGRLPAPVFDTQVSAMVCGFGEAVSYETLVAKLAHKRIDKTMRFTDWQRRPLSPRQIEYALADVTHLRAIYRKLADRIARRNRTGWVAEEMAALSNPAIYQVDPHEAWRRLRVRSARPRFLAILRELAAWREEEARRRDVPRNRVLRDDALLDVAAHAPDTAVDLAGLRSLHGGQSGGPTGEAILAAVVRGKAVPESDCPTVERGRDPTQHAGPTVDLLKVLLKLRSEQHEIAQRLIATGDDIEAIAVDDAADVPALHGWRRELFGGDAIELKNGRLALAIENGMIRVVPLNGAG